MRLLPLLLLPFVFADDDRVDPSKYKSPAEAKSIELKDAPRASNARPYLGISGKRRDEEAGALITRVRDNSPAAKGGLKEGDRVLQLNGKEVESYVKFLSMIRDYKPDEEVELVVLRDEEQEELTIKLGKRETGGLRVWKKPKFNLAIVLFEFKDVKHNPDFTLEDFHQMLFSRRQFTGRDASGTRVHGSMADYWYENSYGKLTITGKVFDWVELDHDRAYFEDRRMGDREARGALLPRALKLVQKREGESCFDPFDGIVFIYAGKQTYKRPWMLWPHRSSIKAGKKTLAYYLNAEGGKFFHAIGVNAHEFGHMVGLPDQYGRGHATGVGKWCTMAIGHMGGGTARNRRPYHICLWCKERLGYVKPVAIDPNEKQWLKLAPIEKDPTQAFKVRVGNATYYFEVRARMGFDMDLEQTGLLIWKSTGRSLDLIEAHGKKVSNASLVEMEDIPFPSFYNRHYTPDTTPAAPDGLYITDIVKQDGSVYFKIGYQKKVETKKVHKRDRY